MIWFFLEVNTVAVIPLLRAYNQGFFYYFIVQAVARVVLLGGVVFDRVSWIAIACLLKLGIWPGYWWVRFVINDITWVAAAFLCTCTKITPLIAVYYCKEDLTFVILFTIIYSTIFGFCETNIKRVLAVSSISHSRWLVLAFTFSQDQMWRFVAFYYPLVICLFVLGYSSYLDEWGRCHKYRYPLYLIILILIGSPPFALFFYKAILCWNLCCPNSFFVLFFLVTRGTEIFYYYHILQGYFGESWADIPPFNWQDGFYTTLLLCPTFLLLVS